MALPSSYSRGSSTKKGVSMQKTNLPQGVRTLMNWRDKGTLKFDNPVQRAGSQWNLLQKSLLIHSMLANYPIPSVYFLKDKDSENVTIYDCLDAKQRLTSVFEFIDGEYALDEDTPEVTVEDTNYNLGGLKFEELSEECQDIIKGYRFNITCIEDASEEEVEDIFARLNNATPLSTIQKCRSIMGSDLAKWCKEMNNHGFFQYSICLTNAQVKREADLEVLLQAMLLLDSRHEGYAWKSISVAEVTKYCKHIRGKYNVDKRRMIEEILDYLFSAFTESHKFLKKSNIPMAMVLAKIAIEHNIKEVDFFDFIDVFNEGLSSAYMQGMGSGNIKRAKTEIRLSAIAKAFEDYMEISNTNILSVHGKDEIPSAKDNVGVDSDEKETLSSPLADRDTSSSETSVENVDISDEFSSSDGVGLSVDATSNSDEIPSVEDDTQVVTSDDGVVPEMCQNNEFMNEPLSSTDENVDNSKNVLEREAV